MKTNQLKIHSQEYMETMARLMSEALESPEGMRALAAAIAAPIEQEIAVGDHRVGIFARGELADGPDTLVAEMNVGRVHVGEADIVGAGSDALDRAGRALAGVHGDVEPLGLVVALLQRHQERRGRPLEHPVQGELDRCLRCRRQGQRQGGSRRRCAQPVGESVHVSHPS